MKTLLLALSLLAALGAEAQVPSFKSFDTNYFTTNSFVIGIQPGLTNKLANTNQFVSPISAMTVRTTNYTHGLGHVPTELRLVLVCTNSDAQLGYAAGDEIPAWAVFD